MANEFYTPGILTQAAGHASTLVADAGKAYGEAFMQMGAWAEANKARQETIQAEQSSRETNIQAEQSSLKTKIQAEKDSQEKAQTFEAGKVAFAAAIERGMAPDEAMQRYFGVATVAQAVGDRRDAARDGVMATGIFSSKVGSLGGQETGHLVSQALQAKREAIQLATSGSITEANARWKEATDLLDNPQLRSNLMKASRSKFPLEANMSAEAYDRQTDFQFSKALMEGKQYSSAGVLQAGGDAFTANTIHQFLVDPTKLSPELVKMAAAASDAAAPTEKGGRARWDIGSQVLHGAQDAYNDLLKTLNPDQQKDEATRLSLVETATRLAMPARAISEASGATAKSVVESMRGAAAAMVGGNDFQGMKSALGALSGLAAAAAQSPDAAKLWPGFLHTMDFSKLTPGAVIRDGSKAFAAYAEANENLGLLDSAAGLIKRPDRKATNEAVLEEVTNRAVGTAGDPSQEVKDRLEQADTLKLRGRSLALTAAGRPQIPGGPIPSPDKAYVAGIASQALASYLTAPQAEKAGIINRAAEQVQSLAKARYGETLSLEEARGLVGEMMDPNGYKAKAEKPPEVAYDPKAQKTPGDIQKLSQMLDDPKTREEARALGISSEAYSIAQGKAKKAAALAGELEKRDPLALSPAQVAYVEKAYPGGMESPDYRKDEWNAASARTNIANSGWDLLKNAGIVGDDEEIHLSGRDSIFNGRGASGFARTLRGVFGPGASNIRGREDNAPVARTLIGVFGPGASNIVGGEDNAPVALFGDFVSNETAAELARAAEGANRITFYALIEETLAPVLRPAAGVGAGRYAVPATGERAKLGPLAISRLAAQADIIKPDPARDSKLDAHAEATAGVKRQGLARGRAELSAPSFMASINVPDYRNPVNAKAAYTDLMAELSDMRGRGDNISKEALAALTAQIQFVMDQIKTDADIQHKQAQMLNAIAHTQNEALRVKFYGISVEDKTSGVTPAAKTQAEVNATSQTELAAEDAAGKKK